MAKYAVFFTLTSDTLARFLQHPEDRRQPVSKLAEAGGGSLESYYWMFGHYDGLAIFDMPSSEDMAAAAFAAISTGTFTAFETHELISSDNLVGIAQRAQSIGRSYRPPGQQGS